VKRNPTNHKYTYSLKSQECVLLIVGAQLADAGDSPNKYLNRCLRLSSPIMWMPFSLFKD